MNQLSVIALIGLVSITVVVGARLGDLAFDPPECPPVGDFYAEHSNCSRYYRCSNGILFELDCPEPLYWSQEIEQCTFQHEVPECVGGTRPPVGPTDGTPEPTTPGQTTPRPTTPRPTTPGPTTPRPTTPGPTTPRPTTPGPTTPGQTTPRPTTPAPTTQGPRPICEFEGVYFVPYEGDCSMYYICIDYQEYLRTCAPELSFDPIELACVPEEISTCIGPTPEPTTPPPTTPPPTTPAPEPICDPEIEDLYFAPYEGNCSLYYICVSGQAFVENCNGDLTFDPVLLQCVEESTCVNPTPPPTQPEQTTEEAEPEPTSTPPALICEAPGVYNVPILGEDCSQYYLCANHVHYLQTCSTGTLFSPDEGRCVREGSYTCPDPEFA